ncbi:hypothetical protein [Limnothrix sp. PR1529]|nr:hypothetical protein [Limnothrix sp. PR1529]
MIAQSAQSHRGDRLGLFGDSNSVGLGPKGRSSQKEGIPGGLILKD